MTVNEEETQLEYLSPQWSQFSLLQNIIVDEEQI
jgi:hypothetical protein